MSGFSRTVEICRCEIGSEARSWRAATAVGLAVLSFAVIPTAGQAPATYKAPRSAFKDGKPDLNGIWQANNTANWDIQGHAARQGPVLELGAAFSIPAGLGVVDGDEIPYQPWAAAKKKENAANWLKLDPEIKCYMPGVPRATYMPYPFQIVQTPTHILMAYEFASASRTIYMNSKDESPADTWMGWSRGRWEGDTLVVDVNAFNGETWFDRAGNFHSEALHVVERYTPVSRDVLQYEATIEDPKVFTRPWKMSMPLYRRVGEERAAPRIQMRGICGRVDVWPSSKKEQVSESLASGDRHVRWRASPVAGQARSSRNRTSAPHALGRSGPAGSVVDRDDYAVRTAQRSRRQSRC